MKTGLANISLIACLLCCLFVCFFALLCLWLGTCVKAASVDRITLLPLPCLPPSQFFYYFIFILFYFIFVPTQNTLLNTSDSYLKSVRA